MDGRVVKEDKKGELITFCGSRRRCKMYCGHARLCVCVCLSVCPRPYAHTTAWGRGRGCPLVVHYWADLQSRHGLRCYGNNANPSYKLASIPRYDDIVRTLCGVCARCRPVTGWWGGRSQKCAPYMGSGRDWLAGDWLTTGGVLNITATAWTAGFRWWRSGNITRTQNVSKYMLVIALFLVWFVVKVAQLRQKGESCHFGQEFMARNFA